LALSDIVKLVLYVEQFSCFMLQFGIESRVAPYTAADRPVVRSRPEQVLDHVISAYAIVWLECVSVMLFYVPYLFQQQDRQFLLLMLEMFVLFFFKIKMHL